MKIILENMIKSIIIGSVKRQLPFMGEMVTFIRQHLHSFFWNSLWLSIGEIVNKLFMFYVVIAVIRYLRPEDYGQLSIAVAMTNIIAVLLDFGMTQVIIRDLSIQRQNASVYLSQVISLKLLLGVIYFVILLFIPEHLIGGKWISILFMIAFMNWVQDLSGAFIAWFIAEERMEKVLYVQCVHYGGIMLATVTAISLDAGLAVIISGQVIAALAGLCTAVFLVFLEGIPIRLIYAPRLITYLFEQSLPLFGVLLIGGIYAN
ncbi:MAG: hypothetical protein FJZ98_09095, partial [Chloroflexi bacterium]|nr:hypothetical protein [Chloroflexota bacterium]